MKNLILLLFLISSVYEISQAQYYNKTIPFSFGNPTVVSGIYHENKLFIPVIYPEEVSTLITLDDNDNVEYFHFDYFDFSVQSILTINDELYFYSKDRSRSKALQIGKWDGINSFEWIKEYRTAGVYNFPGPFVALDEHLYFGYFRKYEDDHRDVEIQKIDILGNVLWKKAFNEDARYSYLDDIEITKDSCLLVSITVGKSFGFYAQLWKMDQEGNTLWITEDDEIMESGYSSGKIHLARLSNGNIVQSYRIKKRFDSLYLANGWNEYPTLLRWYNRDGQELKEKLLINKESKFDETHFLQMKAGVGDWFYAYGYMEELEEGYQSGLVIKFSNEGDTIWAKKYRHPNYNSPEKYHYIKDIFELDNGDLIMLGGILLNDELSKIWVLRTDSMGCLGDNNCDELVVTDIDESLETGEELILYPNPPSGSLQLNLSLSEYIIYDTQGLKVFSGQEYYIGNEIDISGLRSGIYTFLGVTKGNEVFVKKVLVE